MLTAPKWPAISAKAVILTNGEDQYMYWILFAIFERTNHCLFFFFKVLQCTYLSAFFAGEGGEGV